MPFLDELDEGWYEGDDRDARPDEETDPDDFEDEDE